MGSAELLADFDYKNSASLKKRYFYGNLISVLIITWKTWVSGMTSTKTLRSELSILPKPKTENVQSSAYKNGLILLTLL